MQFKRNKSTVQFAINPKCQTRTKIWKQQILKTWKHGSVCNFSNACFIGFLWKWLHILTRMLVWTEDSFNVYLKHIWLDKFHIQSLK